MIGWRGSILSTRASKAGVLLIVSALTLGCDVSDRIEGCGSRARALSDLDVRAYDRATLKLAGLELRLPRNVFYRHDDDTLIVLSQPGIYCDSGDWGIQRDNYLRLRIYPETSPEDAFADFPNELRGHPLEQLELGVGSFEYELPQNALTWRAQAHLRNPLLPRVGLLYLTSRVIIDGTSRGLAIHYFPADAEPGVAVLSVLLASIEQHSRDTIAR